MTTRTVHLGFEYDTKISDLNVSSVEIPVKHMAVTGQTQESGKTTALEALITRSGLASIAFLTKRGESSFSGATRVPAYFQERADWQFVESILESTMKQRMKFERAWIVKACKGAHTLADVQNNVARLQAGSKRSMDQDLFMLLGEYLSKVVPLIRSLPKIDHVGIYGGKLTVMDLVDYPDELQMLVIASTLEWIHKHGGNTITVIPEAWKFIPQGRNSPVKIVAEKLAREGAGLRNYLWIDSQDMAAVDKMLLRACAVWLIGVQREANEIKRALSNMPAGLKKPRAEAVATLELGQFFACFGQSIIKAYVQPAWMSETDARAIASGRLSVHNVAPPHTTKAKQPEQSGQAGEFPAGSAARSHSSVREKESPQSFALQQEEENLDYRAAFLEQKDRADRLERETKLLSGVKQPSSKPQSVAPSEGFCGTECSAPSEERLVQLVIAQVRRDPVLVKLSQQAPAIEVKINRTVVNLDDSTVKGKIAVLIADGFCSGAFDFAGLRKELIRRGMDSKTPNVGLSKAINDYVTMGLFWRNDNGWELAPGAESRVTAA